jgi:DNA primase
MQIPQSVIDEVVQRSDIVEVIGQHLKLKRSGVNYQACCPFHNEKTPSFSVSSVKQIYHCFGCGESGNAISFLMKHLGLDFVSAVKNLAEHAGVIIPEQNSWQPRANKQQIEQQKQHKLDINQLMMQTKLFYQQSLVNSSYARHYLDERGLTQEIIQLFELGFANNSFQNLAPAFKDYASNKLLIDAGLVVQHETGKRYDRFRERVIFPIKNIRGEVIGFGGRIISNGEPKYLNSPETELFNKSRELYGLFEAKKSIRDLNQVIVVEGYMDVIALSQYGITNVVATMGTAVTEEHIKILFRLCDNICYSFDGDKAGRKAAWRALERSIALVSDAKAVKFLFLPEQHDPDSYIRQYGVDSFKQQVSQSTLGIITFLLNQLINEVAINTDEGKARLISLIKPYLGQLRAITLQVLLKKQLASLVDLDPSVVENILNNRGHNVFWGRKQKQINQAYNQLPQNNVNINPIIYLVKGLLTNPSLACEFPVPEANFLTKFNLDIQMLFNLMSYLEANCDTFEDINLTKLIDLGICFESFDLANLYARVCNEKNQYNNSFTLSSSDYCDILYKLIYLPKRKLPPKLN